MKEEALAFLAILMIILILAFFFVVGISVLNQYGGIEKNPSMLINYTGNLQGSCYYEGRSYGCQRNLTKLLDKK